jgi:hypothetical protein
VTQRYARGSRAWGECARSGQRMLLRDMVTDPRTGLRVAPDWAEPPDPLPRTDLSDGIALADPAPDLDKIQYGTVVYPGSLIDTATGDAIRPLVAKAVLGQARGTAA